MPFKCRYCKGIFCSDHRLPPNHDCLFLNEFLKQPQKDREFLEHLDGKYASPGQKIASNIKNTVLLRFSKTEILHLIIGAALVTAVGMSISGFRLRPDYLAIFVSAFLIHELAHKFLAQFYNAWAEFRVQLYGAVITAFSALPFIPFKFIAPGAVFISGSVSERRNGRIALIGPLTNLALGAGFLLAYFVFGSQILLIGARFNAWIAVFNLIPFMGLDGAKIFAWSKRLWILAMAAGIGLYAASDLAAGRFLGIFG
jgi:Zn-dependent protease